MKYYDKAGKSITFERWAELSADSTYKRVGHTEIGDYRISTVWIGLSTIFETMVFPKDSYNDLGCCTYNTLQDAQDGHIKVVYKWVLEEKV